MAINKFIQVRIQENTEIGQYNDALYYTEDEFSALTEADINAAIRARVDNWIAFVQEQSSKPPVPPLPEDLKAEAEQLAIRLSQVTASLSEVGSKEDLQYVKDKVDEASTTVDAAVDAKPISAEPIEEEPVIP